VGRHFCGGQCESSVGLRPEVFKKNLFGRVDEVYTELVNLRGGHGHFISSLMNQLLPVPEAWQRKVESSKTRARDARNVLWGQAEKQIAA